MSILSLKPIRQDNALKVLFLLLVFYPFNGAFSQLSTANGQHISNGEITVRVLDHKIDLLNSKQTISEELKLKIAEIYDEIKDVLDEITQDEQQIIEFHNALKLLPVQLRQLSTEIERQEQELNKRKPESFNNFPLDEVEQRLIIEKSRLSGINTEITQLELQINEQNSRPAKILLEINVVSTERERLLSLAKIAPVVSENKLETEAIVWQSTIRIKVLGSKLKLLELEKISHPLRLQKMKSEIQLLNIKKSGLTQLIKEIDDHILERTQDEVNKLEREMLAAEKDAAGKHAMIQAATRENIQLTRTLQSVHKKMDNISSEKERLMALNATIERDYQSAEIKINLAGLSPALGNMLRMQRRELPTQDSFNEISKQIQSETALTSLEQFRLEGLQNRLSDTGVALQLMMEQQLDSQVTDEEKLLIRTELRLLLNNQKELVNKLYSLHANYANSLVELDFVKQQLINKTEKFSAYLDRRLLWVPSARVIGHDFGSELYQAMQWYFAVENWKRVIDDFIAGINRFPVLSLVFLSIIVLLTSLRHKFCSELEQIRTRVMKPYTDKFSHTLKSFILSLCLVLPLPLFMLFIAEILNAFSGHAPMGKSLASGFGMIVIPLLVIQFFYRLFLPGGIAQTQFNWAPETITQLHRQLGWIRFIVIPALFLIGLSGQDGFSQNAITLGRTGLIIAMLSMCIVMSAFLHPGKGVFINFYRQNPKSWSTQLRHLWYVIGVLSPLIIIAFALAGYYWSALELQQKLVIMIRLVFAAVIIHAMFIRWMSLTNRQLALQNVRQKRKIQEQALKQSSTSGLEGSLIIDEQLLDIPKINYQTRRLLTVSVALFLLVGFWLVWKDILPAFSILDRFVLWHHTGIVDNQETRVPVTLINLLLALVYSFISIVIMRNLPGLLELLLAGKFAVEAGSRYAFNQLAQYSVAAIAFITVANELGGSWSQVQWLVAALSVGLGFGLQEIFANMVSGIILLFERPIRVGDTVSVGEITGKVNRIQMRATQIIDWDQKEVIVPNKTFITDRLVNWSLTDPTTRIVIELGISYNSDVKLALKVITDTVKETPLVLEEPEPSIYFLGFGDSSLNLSIRVFVKELGNRLPLTSELHFRLINALRKHNIEIPFPQRDIHIRSTAYQT